jgi:hypothetical protein
MFSAPSSGAHCKENRSLVAPLSFDGVYLAAYISQVLVVRLLVEHTYRIEPHAHVFAAWLLLRVPPHGERDGRANAGCATTTR